MHTNKDTQDKTIEDLSSLVLSKIQHEHISPTTKTYYVVRNVFLWLPGVMVTCIGAFAWAGILFNSTHSSFKYREFINPKTIPFMVRELPTVWVVLFLFFSLGVIKAFRQTKTGYRYNAVTVLALSMGTSIILGYLIYTGDTYYKNPLLRFPTEHIQRGIWLNPKEGRLVGLIDRRDDEVIYLTDSNQKIWELDTTEIPLFETMLQDDAFVRVIGRKSDDDTFFVCMVLPGVIDDDHPQRFHYAKKNYPTSSTLCDTVLKNIRELHHERKSKIHP